MDAKEDRQRLWLVTEEFDRLVRAWWGDIPQYDVAQRLGVNTTTWSSYRTGARPLSSEFVASVMALFPHVPTTTWLRTGVKAEVAA